MNPPPLLLGAGLLVWGWQTGLLAAAIPMALVLELARWVGWRFELSRRDFHRVADLCTLLFITVIGYHFVVTGFPHAMFGILRWSPVAVFPLVLAQSCSSAGRVGLDALFLTLRAPRLQGEDPVPEVDVRFAFLAVCMLAASAEPRAGPALFAGAALLAGWALWPARPPGTRGVVWAALFALAAAAGWGTQAGLVRAQGWVEEAVLEWISDWLDLDADPSRSVTRIGSIGELKLSGKVVLRVRPGPGTQAPLLLREAAYSVYHDGAWLAKQGKFEPVPGEDDGSAWTLAQPDPEDPVVRVEMTLRDGRGLLPLAEGTRRIAALPAGGLERNPYGAVRVIDGPGFLAFDATFRPGSERAEPGEFDLRVPARLEPVLREVADGLRLRELGAAEAVQALRRHFDERFGYSLQAGGRGGEHALEDFLLRSRSGHCEYFATATALLLRSAGIPARYAVGYSVQEYSPREGAYLARRRHAHAWALAWVDGAWRSVDTTPAAWAETEAREDSVLQPLLDIFSWMGFRYQRWRWAPR
ncbi:MAG TPA: transglutaminase-like domain-containing protein, partial [Burkholderiales bacterium]|nr:transglutaminase-like domain-containing protein [Burkholderiales bacterium]